MPQHPLRPRRGRRPHRRRWPMRRRSVQASSSAGFCREWRRNSAGLGVGDSSVANGDETRRERGISASCVAPAAPRLHARAAAHQGLELGPGGDGAAARAACRDGAVRDTECVAGEGVAVGGEVAEGPVQRAVRARLGEPDALLGDEVDAVVDLDGALVAFQPGCVDGAEIGAVVGDARGGRRSRSLRPGGPHRPRGSRRGLRAGRRPMPLGSTRRSGLLGGGRRRGAAAPPRRGGAR